MNETVTDFTWDDYQKIIKETGFYPDYGNNMWYPALGLTGESGEVAEKIKKFYRDGVLKTVGMQNAYDMSDSEAGKAEVMRIAEDEFKRVLSRELGDVLWYLTAIANEKGIRLEDIARGNYQKLMERRRTNTLAGSGDDREIEK